MPGQSVSPIGMNVARYRKAEGISAAELAEKAGEGLTRSVIANLENGRKDDVSVKQLMAISFALHVPPALLVADVFRPGVESKYPIPSYETAGLDFATREMVKKPGLNRNADLIPWFGAQSFRSSYPIKRPAARMAEQAYAALRAYSSAWNNFYGAAIRYANATRDVASESDQLQEEAELQRYARSVFPAIDMMRRASIEPSTDLENSVFEVLGDLGLTFDPDPNPFGAQDFDG